MARVDQVVDGIYRICTTVQLPDTEFQFNQFLIDDERPALIHTGMYGLYEGVHDGVAEVIDPGKLDYAILLFATTSRSPSHLSCSERSEAGRRLRATRHQRVALEQHSWPSGNMGVVELRDENVLPGAGCRGACCETRQAGFLNPKGTSVHGAWAVQDPSRRRVPVTRRGASCPLTGRVENQHRGHP